MNLRTHAAAFALGAVLSAVAAWKLLPRPAAVTVDRAVQGAAIERIREVAGPVRVETRTVTRTVPGPERPGPVREVTVVRIEERAGTVREVAGATVVEERLRTVTVPAPRPVWAVGVGAQVLPDVRAELALERRLFGPVWLRAAVVQPLRVEAPAVVVGLRIEL